MSKHDFNTNRKDFPSDLQVRPHNKYPILYSEKLLSLFNEKDTLSLSEIVVALYSKYKIKRSRLQISAYMGTVLKKRKNKVVSVGTGVWRIKND